MRLGRAALAIQRIYAIGDIHGRYDLFKRLVAIIERDNVTRGPAATKIILLGDIVDRGPDTARLVQGCMMLTRTSDRFMVLKGNHEAMMVEALRGDLHGFERWLQFGGRETLMSWGIDAAALERPTAQALRTAAEVVGPEVIEWLSQLPISYRHEDYVFVHAGIRPGVRLSRQSEDDMLWISEEFLESSEDYGFKVVHGHSIHEDGADFRSNRIGIDTGAYRTGRLTALGIESGNTWTVGTTPNEPPKRTQGDVALDRYYSHLIATAQNAARKPQAEKR